MNGCVNLRNLYKFKTIRWLPVFDATSWNVFLKLYEFIHVSRTCILVYDDPEFKNLYFVQLNLKISVVWCPSSVYKRSGFLTRVSDVTLYQVSLNIIAVKFCCIFLAFILDVCMYIMSRHRSSTRYKILIYKMMPIVSNY